MIDSVVIATDGSKSADRAVNVGFDLARRFDAMVHGVYVVSNEEVDAAPSGIRDEYRDGLEDQGRDCLARLTDEFEGEIVTAILSGRPADEICSYAENQGVDVVTMGTRGRHGEYRFTVGSVAERVVRTCPVPVLTVRQLDAAE